MTHARATRRGGVWLSEDSAGEEGIEVGWSGGCVRMVVGDGVEEELAVARRARMPRGAGAERHGVERLERRRGAAYDVEVDLGIAHHAPPALAPPSLELRLDEGDHAVRTGE
jgi:hypothetical protein